MLSSMAWRACTTWSRVNVLIGTFMYRPPPSGDLIQRRAHEIQRPSRVYCQTNRCWNDSVRADIFKHSLSSAIPVIQTMPWSLAHFIVSSSAVTPPSSRILLKPLRCFFLTSSEMGPWSMKTSLAPLALNSPSRSGLRVVAATTKALRKGCCSESNGCCSPSN